MKEKILVTGGTGYIGSHTAVELIENGFEVVIVDDLSNSKVEVIDGIEAITGIRPHLEVFDLCDKGRLAAFFEDHKDLKSIIHFAASKAVGESVEKPLLYYRNNLTSLINLLELMRDMDVKSIVFSSSCTVYGQPDRLPVTEQSPIKPAESPYGKTKQMCEDILRDSVHAYKGIHGIALRYFNPVGAHDSALIGELPLGVPNNLVPYITQTAAGIREELSVFGDDYDTPDGTAIRDYIHVVDLAKAHVVAVMRMIENGQKAPYEIFNLGTGNGYSVLDVVTAFEKAAGLSLNYKIVGRREGDIEKVWADTQYANNELGWKAERGIDNMMATAWKWQKHLED
jgi:UDP-glucose 4-epimerase